MARYLITKSLLSSWAYMFDCREGSEEEAKEDFLRTLRREDSEISEAAANGIDFENEVYSVVAGAKRNPHPQWEQGIQAVAAEIQGAAIQVRLSREIEVRGMTFLAYGILDALKAGTISDVKFKNKAFGGLELAGSYLSDPQHPMYFYLCPEAYEFRYLVSDGEDLYIERYTPEETRPISAFIAEFIDSITGMGLLDLYKEKWEAK